MQTTKAFLVEHSVSGFTALHTFPSRRDTVCGKRPRQTMTRFTSRRVIILNRLQHEGLVAAASITVCLLRLLKVLDLLKQHRYPKAP